MSGRSPSTRIPALSSLAVVSCPAPNKNVAGRTTSVTSGVDPSGYLAVGNELVDMAIGKPPHEVLILLQPLRGQQPTEQRPRIGVVRRVHRDHVLVHPDLGAGLVE